MKIKVLAIVLVCFFCFNAVVAEEYTPSQQAVIYYNDNNLKKAFEILTSIEEDKKTAQDWFLSGNILQDDDKISEAVFMYKRAILVNKDFYKPYYNLANIYLENEQTYMAVDNYKKVIKLKPDFAYVHYNLGCAYLRLGELSKAKSSLLKAISLKNSEPDFYYNLAYTFKKMKKEKQAKKYLDIYNKLTKNN